jgi:ABC-type branched-subunit amino acid transport system substrate-binding protein
VGGARRPQAARGGRRALVGAPVPLSGRYAPQGAQVRAGLELWAQRAGAALRIEDDRSDPGRAARLHAELEAAGCRLVLGPYGSDTTRACAGRGAVVWNHGAAADDVQRMAPVVSVPSPASRYLVALGRAVAELRPGGRVAIAAGRGRFARLAAAGLEATAESLGLELLGRFPLTVPPERVLAAGADAVLACGPLKPELALLRRLAARSPHALLGGVSPGILAFPRQLGGDPDGFLAPVQWHRDLGAAPELGPPSAELLRAARARGLPEPDYLAAQAYAAALVAERCSALAPEDPLLAARELATSTFFGRFRLDPRTGLQRGHRLSVVRWTRGRQQLLLAEAA